MLGLESGRLRAGASEKTHELAETSPTSAGVGAALAYLGVRFVRHGQEKGT